MEQRGPAVGVGLRQVGPGAGCRAMRVEQRAVQGRQPSVDAEQQELADDVVQTHEALRRIEGERQRQAMQPLAQVLGVEVVESARALSQKRLDVDRGMLDVLGKDGQLGRSARVPPRVRRSMLSSTVRATAW